MQNPYFIASCCTLIFVPMYLIHMYYIYFSDINIHKPIKEKTDRDYWGTTHTTSLKSAPGLTNLLYPRHFYMGTTWVQQHTTFCFFELSYLYFIDLMTFTFCCMLYPCFILMKNQKMI
jgi:hypothetical protein